jgi:hypothetical protein
MSDEPDPEVIDDLKLRAASMFDRSRNAREARWVPPVFVDKWPCKTPACKKPVEITEETMDRYVMFNRMLAARSEEKLDFTQIVSCDSCRAELTRTAPDRRRKQVDRMRPVIQQVKASKNPEAEIAAIRQLESWKHPDIAGLVQATRDKLNTPGKKAKKGEV